MRTRKNSVGSLTCSGSIALVEQHLLPTDTIEEGAGIVVFLQVLFSFLFFPLSFLDIIIVLLCCFKLWLCVRLAVCIRAICFSTWYREDPTLAAA